MPDLSNLLVPPASPALPSCSTSLAAAGAEAPEEGLGCKWSHRLRFPISKRIKRDARAGKRAANGGSLVEHVRTWAEMKVANGVPERECELPFLTSGPRMVECCLCNKCVYPGEEVVCSVRDCKKVFHRTCAVEKLGFSSSKSFKCPQHACFVCKQKSYWRCVRCNIATHTKCAPWPNKVIHLNDRPGWAVCWRHSVDWRRDNQHTDLASDVKEIFSRLPLPYMDEEFNIGSILKDALQNKAVPAPYIHIKRNVYLVKKKRDVEEAGSGCTTCNANSTCRSKCECRGLSISCSKACHCSDMCQNRPFRKDKKTKVVKTESCGWGVEALESMKRGDFVIEYIGEVIDDALCEQRLWNMKYRGDTNFYMCEIRKNFIIDATFKGNASRFLNHSCDPNCKLEKWQVDGETRVGVFASRSIKVGEPLTYDYRFVQFGPMVKCLCGASNCQGFIGNKRKTDHAALSWGLKRKRTTAVTASSNRLLL